jgi:hypothetical protein
VADVVAGFHAAFEGLIAVADAGRGAGLVADAGGLVDNGIGAGAFGISAPNA